MKTKNLFLTICIATLCFALLPLNSNAQAPNYLWAKSAGGSSNDEAKSVTTDAWGNIYVVGHFRSPTITFGSYTLNNAGVGFLDMFIVKYDASGNVLWAKNSSGVYDEEAYSVTTDATGNTIVAGYFSGTSVTFGSITLSSAGFVDMFIVKYDVSGNVLWAKSAGGSGREEAKSVTTDANGNILVVGIFNSPAITFGSFTLTTIYTTWSNIFIVKYDASGNVLWAKSAGGGNNGGEDIPNSVTTDANGNIIMVGSFKTYTITFGSITLNNPYTGTTGGLPAIFIVKYDSNGNALWAKNGSTEYSVANSVTTDANGNVLMVGFFNSPTITFGSTTLTNTGTSSSEFILKYDAAGNVLWAKDPVGTTGGDVAHSISTDANGNSYVVGYFRGSTITFGSYTLNNANPNNTEDIFIVKYDVSGNAIWAKSAGGADYDRASSVSTDANGNIIMVGHFGSPTITFGSYTLNNANNNDEVIFVAKLNSATGIESLENTTGVNIFPNPSNGKYIIEMENVKGQVDEGMIEIYNVIGEIIYNSAFQQLNNTTIDISEKPNGVYFLTIISDKGKRTIKILKY